MVAPVRKFSLTAYSGGPLRVSGYTHEIVVDLAGLTTRGGRVVVNLDHNDKARVGHVTAIENDSRQLMLSGVVSGSGPAADEFVAAAEKGFPWGVSIEAVPKELDTLADGQTAIVNGRTVEGPVYIARKAILVGVAVLSQPADADTSAALAANMRRGTVMKFDADPELTARLDQCAIDHAERERAILRMHAETPTVKIAASAAASIRARIAEVQLHDSGMRQYLALAERRALTGELDAAGFEAELSAIVAADQRYEATMQTFPLTHGVYSTPRSTPNLITASLCLAGGLAGPERFFDQNTLEQADKLARQTSLQTVLLAAAAEAGYRAAPGERITQGNLRAVLQAAFAPIHASGFSTLSLPNTLAATANKFLMEGWQSVDQTCLRIAKIRPVNNFKTITTISLTGGLMYEKLGSQGEIKHGMLGETTYTGKADTYALMNAISRTDIINDDLSALTEVPRRLGRGGMLKLNDIFWTSFLNNGSFFTTGRNNYVAGSTTALSLDALATAEALFINQVDPDSNPLGLLPSILLVPTSLKATALSLVNSQLIVVGSNTTLPNANIWQGRYRVESSPYMSNSGYVGNSATMWYLLANPAELPVIEIQALNGRVEPTVETADAEFNTLGVQLRGYSDVGCSLQEYRAGVAMKGVT